MSLLNITTSYAIEIRHMNKIFKPTVEIFNEAVSFCIPAFEKHWSDLCKIKGILNQRAFGERLIHTTKNHTAPRLRLYVNQPFSQNLIKAQNELLNKMGDLF